MKKFKLLLLLFFAAIFITITWYSCDKEELHSQSISQPKQVGSGTSATDDGGGTIDTCALLISQITNSTTYNMLSFSSAEHFNKVVICLEARVDKYNDDFEAAHPNTTDEEIQAIIDASGWNEDQPLIDLEASLGFMSLRRYIENQVDTWLNSSNPDPATDPNDHIITDEETRSLLTPGCQALIGGQVVNFCTPGENTLTNDSGISAMPVGLCLSGCCFWGKSKGELNFDNGTKKIIVYVSLHNKLAWPAKAKGKVKACKKDGNKWKRYRTDLRISVAGSVFQLNGCNDAPAPFAKQKAQNGGTKRRAKLRVANNSWNEMKWSMNGFISAIGFQSVSQNTSLLVPLTF